MIEITIDGNDDNEFLGRPRQVYEIKDFDGKCFDDYRPIARDILNSFPAQQIIIVRNHSANCSDNQLALALFVESCHIENNIENIIFKVADAQKSLEAYKPYVALTIGLKYVMRLLAENPKMIYKEIALLNYLGLDISHDYLRNKLQIKLSGDEPVRKMTGENTDDALVIIGVLKSLALAHTSASICAELEISPQPVSLNEDELIHRIISGVQPWING